MRSLAVSILLVAILAVSCSVNEEDTVGQAFLLEQGFSPKTFGDTTLSEGIIESTFTQRAQTIFPNAMLVEAKWNGTETRIFLRFSVDTSIGNFNGATLVLHENTPVKRLGPPPDLTVFTTEKIGDIERNALQSVSVQVDTASVETWSFRLDPDLINRIIVPDSGQTAAKVEFRIDFPDSAPDFIRRFRSISSELSLRPTLKFLLNGNTVDSVFADSSGFVAEAPLPVKPTIAIFPSDRGVLVLNANRLIQSIDSNVVLARATATFFIDTANVLVEHDTLSVLEVRAGFKDDVTSIAPPTTSASVRIRNTPEVQIDITHAFQEFQLSRRQSGAQTRDLGLFLDAQTLNNTLLIVPLLDSIKIDLLFSR